MDLLLFLIRRHQIDVFDIPMTFICERYTEALEMMESLNIDVASEFLFMASELLHIKSKMLLPQPEDVEADEEDADPRAELVKRLLEYQKYKEAASQLDGLDRFGRDVFDRPSDIPSVDGPLKEVGVFALIEVFDTILKRQEPEIRHHVEVETTSLADKMRKMIHALLDQEAVTFEELVGPIRGRSDLVVTFLSCLEMTKLRLLKIYQSEEGTLYIRPRFETLEGATQKLAGLDESQYA